MGAGAGTTRLERKDQANVGRWGRRAERGREVGWLGGVWRVRGKPGRARRVEGGSESESDARPPGSGQQRANPAPGQSPGLTNHRRRDESAGLANRSQACRQFC